MKRYLVLVDGTRIEFEYRGRPIQPTRLTPDQEWELYRERAALRAAQMRREFIEQYGAL